MKIFYGAAIQGAKSRGEKADLHKKLIGLIRNKGHQVISEHMTGKSKKETSRLLKKAFGTLPPIGFKRTRYVRVKMIEAIEGNCDAAIFEVSIPSLGTGVEIAHAYLRPRLGKKEIPILLLYQEGYWQNGLSSMIRGISSDEVSKCQIKEYKNEKESEVLVSEFLNGLN